MRNWVFIIELCWQFMRLGINKNSRLTYIKRELLSVLIIYTRNERDLICQKR